jgi:NADH-quinone oxidoreductase subunit J
MTVVFYISAVLAVVATILAITRANAVHALLYFICSLLATGVMFFVLGAPFVAALVVIINAGAIIVLFVFVVMMLNLGPAAADHERAWLRPRAWIGPVAISVLLLAELAYSVVAQPSWRGRPALVSRGHPGLALPRYEPRVLPQVQGQDALATEEQGQDALATAEVPPAIVQARQVGMALFGPYLLGVELASMLLLAGLLGAYHLGRGATGPKETGV